MRHRKAGYKLGRTTAHRTATIRNMAASLFEHGQIVTTLPRAKTLQPFVERIITLAKRGDLHSRRLVIQKMGDNRKAFDWTYLPKDATDSERETVEKQRTAAEQYFDIPDSDSVERNRYGELRKAPRLVSHIFDNVAPRFADREGGYTRIVRIGARRKGDAGELCVIQFVGAEDGPEIGGGNSTRRRIADNRQAYFEKISAGWTTKESATAVAEPEAQVEEAPEADSDESKD